VAQAPLASVSERSIAAVLNLPKPGHEYLRRPTSTLRSLVRFLNARWQLRHCDDVGAWVRMTGVGHIRNQGVIHIGQRVDMYSRPVGIVLATFPGGRLEIGARTVLNYGVDIAAVKLVHIGADCLIGTHVSILDNDFHELAARNLMPESRPVVIGDGVWIGNRALIMPGVSIGDGAAVGAGSVVMTDIPERCLALGNPARVIKKF
jgi:acetyltransferase-like isoleucine patch superfamily enzyme